MVETRHSHGAGAPDGRRILHVDMDAFFAAVEQRDDPALRGRPVAVGGAGPRGVVMTASYEARASGVRSAMPTGMALRLCPGLLVVRPRFDAYREASARVREVLRRWSDLVEPLALDEAYLDVTRPLPGPTPAVRVARAVRAEIAGATGGLTASAGVATNKFLAKLASEARKPDGLAVLRPADAPAFLAALPVGRFHGVGPATARRLHALGLRTGADLRAADPAELRRRLGRLGPALHALSLGVDERPVRPDRPRLSLGVESTLERDVGTAAAMLEVLAGLAAELARRRERAGFDGRTLTLKLKTARFELRTRSLTAASPPRAAAEILGLARRLLPAALGDGAGPVRLLGLTLGRGAGGGPAGAQGGGDARQLPLLPTDAGDA